VFANCGHFESKKNTKNGTMALSTSTKFRKQIEVHVGKDKVEELH